MVIVVVVVVFEMSRFFPLPIGSTPGGMESECGLQQSILQVVKRSDGGLNLV